MYHITYRDDDGTMKSSAKKIAERNGVETDAGIFDGIFVSFMSEDPQRLEEIRKGLSEWPVAASGRWMLD